MLYTHYFLLWLCGECMITLSLPRSGACNLAILIVHLCSPRGCCVVLAVSECNTAKCSFSAVRPPWEAFDQLRCCVCFRVSLLTCSAPWLSGVLSELKPGFLQIVFNRIRRRVHDRLQTVGDVLWTCAPRNLRIFACLFKLYSIWGIFFQMIFLNDESI